MPTPAPSAVKSLVRSPTLASPSRLTAVTALLVWSPVVEMLRVPALPSALGRILEIRAALINDTGARLCLERGALPADIVQQVVDQAA